MLLSSPPPRLFLGSAYGAIDPYSEENHPVSSLTAALRLQVLGGLSVSAYIKSTKKGISGGKHSGGD
jgi:hypothetical protein